MFPIFSFLERPNSNGPGVTPSTVRRLTNLHPKVSGEKGVFFLSRKRFATSKSHRPVCDVSSAVPRECTSHDDACPGENGRDGNAGSARARVAREFTRCRTTDAESKGEYESRRNHVSAKTGRPQWQCVGAARFLPAMGRRAEFHSRYAPRSVPSTITPRLVRPVSDNAPVALFGPFQREIPACHLCGGRPHSARAGKRRVIYARRLTIDKHTRLM